MFDYCIWRREQWLQECEDEEGEIALPRNEPGWGDVYNYGNMHADLESNDATDGDFVNAICTEYYDLIEDNADFDAAVAATFDDQGEGDDEDEDEDIY